MNTTNNALVSAFQKIFRKKRVNTPAPVPEVKTEALPVPVNVPITYAEMRAAREAFVPGKMSSYFITMFRAGSQGPNRRQRRAELHARKPISNRAQLPNNRSQPVTRYHVFLKLAHFFLALSGLKNGMKPAV